MAPACAQEEAVAKKKRYGRLQKAMGDYSLLAGSPADASDHYQTSADLAGACNDSIWLGAAIEGMAHAKVREGGREGWTERRMDGQTDGLDSYSPPLARC